MDIDMELMKIKKKEYLKKYLGGSDGMKKKKKKKLKIGPKRVKVIDDDVDLRNMRPIEDEEFAILNTTEDAPQIVGVIDERGSTDFTDRKRWKVIADDGEGNVAITAYDNQHNLSKNKSSLIIEDFDLQIPDVELLKNSKRQKNIVKDLSPPRKSQKKLKKSSTNHGNVDSDLTPPRKSKKESKQSKRNSESDSDLSPPRQSRKQSFETSKNNTQYDSDLNLLRKSRQEFKTSKNNRRSDSDLNPPRKSRKEPKKFRSHEGSDSDQSPPHKSRKESTKKLKNYRESNLDLSPPRKPRKDLSKNHRGSDSDSSPPRKSFKESQNSKNHRELDSDLSPPRKSRKEPSKHSRNNRGSDSDQSPPRNSRASSKNSRYSGKTSELSKHDKRKPPEYRKSRWETDSRQTKSPENDKRLKKTLDGKTAGLQNAQALREETIAHKQREAELFNKMDAETSGVGQAPVMRDRKTGKRRDLEAEAVEREKKEERQKEVDEKYARWGKGLKQVDDQAEKLQDDLYEMSKPLARYADDPDLDARLRAVEREGDPMLEYIKKKQIKEGKRKPDEPRYQGAYMPNRFGIEPGHRWDGVDRSNGYEKKWFDAKNAKTAVQEEAYKWSTADM